MVGLCLRHAKLLGGDHRQLDYDLPSAGTRLVASFWSEVHVLGVLLVETMFSLFTPRQRDDLAAARACPSDSERGRSYRPQSHMKSRQPLAMSLNCDAAWECSSKPIDLEELRSC